MLKLPFLILSCIGIFMSQGVLASTWQNLWLNKNQQGSQLLKQNKNTQAAQTFTDKHWKGIAYYRDGKYQEAYNEFKEDNSAQGLYNQGNALAQLGKYEEAIDAYNKSLQLEKNSPDATYNKQLIEKLLKQQQENQSQQDKDNSSKQNKEQQKDQQQDSSKNGQDKKSQQNNTNNQQQSSNSEQKSGSKPNSGSQSDKPQQNGSQQQTPQKPDNTSQQTRGQSPTNSQSGQQGINREQNKEKLNKTQEKQLNQQLPNSTQAISPTTNMGKPNYMRPQTAVDKEVKSALSQIPDDPGGLLRNKFLRDYQKQTQENK